MLEAQESHSACQIDWRTIIIINSFVEIMGRVTYLLLSIFDSLANVWVQVYSFRTNFSIRKFQLVCWNDPALKLIGHKHIRFDFDEWNKTKIRNFSFFFRKFLSNLRFNLRLKVRPGSIFSNDIFWILILLNKKLFYQSFSCTFSKNFCSIQQAFLTHSSL